MYSDEMEVVNYQKMLYYAILLCFVLFQESIGKENTWPPQKPSKPARGPYGTIDIDNPQGFYDGSADRDISGHGPYETDDEDEVEMSGVHEVSHVSLTKCQEQRLIAGKTPGEHQPKCSEAGDFEPVQCNAGYCWCVSPTGDEISATRLRATLQRPDCRNLDRGQVRVVPQEASPPKATKETDARSKDEDTAGIDRDTADVADDDNSEDQKQSRLHIFDHPGILAGIIGGAVFGLLCAVLLVMFIVYRMRKNDDLLYPMKLPPSVGYMRTPQVFT